MKPSPSMHRKPILMLATAVMAGHAQVKTFPHIGMDPATAPLLKRMLGQDGKPRVLEEVAIASIRGTSVQEE